MAWLIAGIVIVICFFLSRIEDYSNFNFDEEAIYVGRRKVVKINYNSIKTIERNPHCIYESNVTYYRYSFYYLDKKGHEAKFSMMRASTMNEIKKWKQFKEKLIDVNPGVLIDENSLLDK